jgi:hypothetical protein
VRRRFLLDFSYTPKPEVPTVPVIGIVELQPSQGMLILDVVNGEISCIEVLDRNDVRRKLQETLP